MDLFKYGKNNKRYWNRPKLYKLIVNKAFLIAKILYLRYLHLFLFDNVTSYSIYTDNTLCIGEINKESSRKQV